MTASIIAIGDEILIGQTLDTNSHWMAQQLSLLGIQVLEIKAIADKEEAIVGALDHALKQSELILITGGLGPTEDDITKDILANYFGGGMVCNEEILADIEAYFARRKRPMPDSVKGLAMVPKKCKVLRNAKGTAASMLFQEKGSIIVSMPGVPYEMKDMMQREILPLLSRRLGNNVASHKTIQTVGLGESIIAEKIKPVVKQLPEHIKVAYLPSLGAVKIRLSGIGDKERVTKEIDDYTHQIVELLPKYVFGYNDDKLEIVLGQILKENDVTLGTAESCTGGYIAHKITSIAGSSAYFQGSAVTYSNELKMKMLGVKQSTLEANGAVSEATVKEMAQGVIKCLGVDYAIAVSGIAGPGGGSPEKPVGTVWVAVANKNEVRTQLLNLSKSRDINIPLTATLAMNELRKFILGL